MFTTINLKNWIAENRQLLKPPVGNKCVWENREFIVMIVGGPNTRTDYHVNLSEEFFYQLEGDIVLKVIDNGKPLDISIKEGEIFLLPANTPHSPRRPANTVGLVIERQRKETEIDALQWYCEKCGEKLYEEQFKLTDITGQFQPIFERFFNSDAGTCKKCGTRAKQ